MSKNQLKFKPSLNLSVNSIAVMVTLVLNVWAMGAVNALSFHDIVSEPGTGIDYRRAKSLRDAIFAAFRSRPVFNFTDVPLTPEKARGAPGVAILDYDRDGDEDIYVTNGPGVANALYSNQLVETGRLSFVDMATSAGVTATDMDSNGVCFGDIDNDGDEDLYVLGAGEPNRLFENQGGRTFSDITDTSSANTNAVVHYGVGCSMGDVNGDGLLDIVIGNNSITWDNRLSVFEPFAFNDHNSLLINQGNNIFIDKSKESGLEDLAGFPEFAKGSAGRTWAISMVDFDQDGDLDIFVGDDQGAVPDASHGGIDRGSIHLMQNNGKGKFSDVSIQAKTNKVGAWMGFTFGDYNLDGHLDMFVTNAGDYALQLFPFPYNLGEQASRWFLGQANGTFLDPGVGQLIATPFGWGDVSFDYDNDGDTDIMFNGGIDTGPYVDASNPGTILKNDGTANFSYDTDALKSSNRQARHRSVLGVASGDLNQDGFVDIVSVSDFDIPSSFPLKKYPKAWGSLADVTAKFFPSFIPAGPGQFTPSGLRPDDGTLAIDLNSGDNGNRSVAVKLTGTVGLTGKGKANRDGIGAIVSFTPDDGKTVMRPILGGASYASQDSLTAHFGLGQADEGMVEVLWPGGVRNRLYNVKASEHIKIPEIPCGFNINWKSKDGYEQCVIRALREIIKAGVIDRSQSNRLMLSAFRAYREARETHHRRQNDD